jgi:hypothetical protein
MKIKIRPSLSECRVCMETAMSFDAQPHCSECNTKVYEVLKFEKDYLYYMDDRKIKKIHMNYVIVEEK